MRRDGDAEIQVGKGGMRWKTGTSSVDARKCSSAKRHAAQQVEALRNYRPACAQDQHSHALRKNHKQAGKQAPARRHGTAALRAHVDVHRGVVALKCRRRSQDCFATWGRCRAAQSVEKSRSPPASARALALAGPYRSHFGQTSAHMITGGSSDTPPMPHWKEASSSTSSSSSTTARSGTDAFLTHSSRAMLPQSKKGSQGARGRLAKGRYP